MSEIVGVDGEYVDRSRLLIPKNAFLSHDLTIQLDLSRRFDLTVCLEVGEHLDQSAEGALLSTICAHSDVVLFSAAIPHQGGTDHRNERWQPYWAERFICRGYQPFNVLRPMFWNDPRVAPWYRQNAMIYVREADRYSRKLAEAIRPMRSLSGLPVVHPEVWTQSHRQGEYQLGNAVGPLALVARLPAATIRALARRLAASRADSRSEPAM